MSAEDLAAYLRRRMAEKRLNNSTVALRAGISRRTWYRLLNAEIEEAKLSTLIRLAHTLDSSVSTFLKIYFNGEKINQTKEANTRGIISDINYPPNSLIYINTSFIKKWKVINTTKSNWKYFKLKTIDEELYIKIKKDQERNQSIISTDVLLTSPVLTPKISLIALPDVAPGQSVEISVEFTAPDAPGTVVSNWQIVDENNKPLQSKTPYILQCIVNVVDIN